MKIDKFQGSKPEFKIEEFFSGKSGVWGLVYNRSGEVIRTFSGTMVGSVEGDLLTLDEEFRFDDGEEQQRVWKIKKLAEGHYQGEAGDVIGTAEGRSAGAAVNFKYVAEVKTEGRTWEITFDDWMFRQSEDLIINRAEMSKFGLKVGEVLIVIKKLD